MDITKIGILIRQERILKSLTQEELGVKIGVRKAQISKIENGSVVNIKTLKKVIDVLEMNLNVKISTPRQLNHKIAGFIIACISEFAVSYNLTIREASNYLKRYQGLDFLTKHYDAQHLLSIEDSVQDLAKICYNNGGAIK